MFETKSAAQIACSLAPRQATKKKLPLKFLTFNQKVGSGGDAKASPHGLSQPYSPVGGGRRRATREGVKEKTGQDSARVACCGEGKGGSGCGQRRERGWGHPNPLDLRHVWAGLGE